MLPNHYIALRAAAEQVYRALTGSREAAPLHPTFLEAAAAALSVFVTVQRVNGEPAIHARELAPAIERLRRAGVCFSQVMA